MRAVLNMLNQIRGQYGARALTINMTQSNGTSSCAGSLGHSKAMAESGKVWHSNPSYPGASFPNDLCSGPDGSENVGYWDTGNELTDLQDMTDGMMTEAHDTATCHQYIDHACSIINPYETTVGIGIVQQGGYTWLTEDFTPWQQP